MIYPKYSGRLGNLLLENVGISIISKKFNLRVSNYASFEEFSILGLKLHQGEREFLNIENVYDTHLPHVQTGPYGTLTDLMNREEDLYSGILFDGNFQVKEFIQKYRKEILSHFELKYTENHLEDVFIHVRLGDVSHYNPGYEYYSKCIEMLKFKNIYLSTDTLNHPIVQTLVENYNITIYDNNPIETINFAKDFGNLILSKGTFSWWIGMLSKSKNILYPVGDKPWYGDIFVYEDWKGVSIK